MYGFYSSDPLIQEINGIVKGYDTIANGATLAMPSFELYFGHLDTATNTLYLDSIWTSLWSSMSNVGSILGSAVAGPLSQRIGRRYTGISFAAVTVCSSIWRRDVTDAGRLLVYPFNIRPRVKVHCLQARSSTA